MAQMSIDVLNWYMKKKNPKESMKERIKEGGKYVWQPESKQQGVDLNPTI